MNKPISGNSTSLTVVSVIIPTREEEANIRTCLDSILSGYYPLDRLEVIIVDGMSNDGTREIVKGYAAQYPQIKLLDNPRLITPVALNIGAKAAQGDVIVILGAHSHVDKEFLSRSVSTLLEHPEADCVGGVMNVEGGSPWQQAVRAALASPLATGSSRFSCKSGYVTTVNYGAYRKDVFEKYGLFDEHFVRAQDYEFNLRIVRAGGKIYQDPAIKSCYYPRISPARLFSQYFQYGNWKMRVLMKHGALSIKNFIPPLFFLAVLASALCCLIDLSFRYVLIVLVGGYLATLTIAASRAWKQNGRGTRRLLIVVVLSIIHVGFALGFYKGMGSAFLSGRRSRSLAGGE